MTLVGTVSSFPAAGEGALTSVLHLMAQKRREVKLPGITQLCVTVQQGPQ